MRRLSVLCILLALAATARADVGSEPGEVIVKYRRTAAAPRRAEVLAMSRGTLVRRLDLIGG